MLKIYPNLFFQEYIYKHHILRFLGSNVIHRSEPWYFYFITLLWGLFPHIFVLFSKISGIKNIKFDLKDDYSRFLLLNTIAVLSILGFFSLSSTKLITYILPIYPFFAVIIGAIWFKYIKNDEELNKQMKAVEFEQALMRGEVSLEEQKLTDEQRELAERLRRGNN